MILFAVTAISITAYNSVGFFHADEHYQILEFIGIKSGTNTSGDMAWEYQQQIRSSLLPSIGYVFVSIFKFFGITDPYTHSFLLREITGLLMITALVWFFNTTKRFIGSAKFPQYNSLLTALYLGFLLLIWYVPYLGVRFSSETWSAIFLLFGMGCFFTENKSKRTLVVTGVFFGLSFLFRFQIAFALLGFGMHLLLFGKEKLKSSLLILSGFSCLLIPGILIDHWFYGNWGFTPWNYFWLFFENNVLKQQVSAFGTSSWVYYFDRMFHLPTKLIGSLMLLSLAAMILFKRTAVLLWMTLSFLLFHLLIDHKEERFLFPIVFFFPFFFLLFFQLLIDYIPRKIAITLIGLTSFGILVTSAVGIPVMAVNSAGLGRNGLTRFIHETYHGRPVNLIAMPYSNPYNPWSVTEERFYKDQNVSFTTIDNFEQLDSSDIQEGKVNLFVTMVTYLDHFPKNERIHQLGFRLIKKSVPDYQLKLDKYVREIEDQYVTYLYELKK